MGERQGIGKGLASVGERRLSACVGKATARYDIECGDFGLAGVIRTADARKHAGCNSRDTIGASSIARSGGKTQCFWTQPWRRSTRIQCKTTALVDQPRSKPDHGAWPYQPRPLPRSLILSGRAMSHRPQEIDQGREAQGRAGTQARCHRQVRGPQDLCGAQSSDGDARQAATSLHHR